MWPPPCRLLFLFSLIALLFLIAGCGGAGTPAPQTPTANTPTTPPADSPAPPQPSPPPAPNPPPTDPVLVVEEVAGGLNVPWEIAFAPDGRTFFTEQPGRLRVIVNGQLVATPVFAADTPGGEAGMLGLEIDRNFLSNHFLYVFHCYTAATNRCRIVRLREQNNAAVLDHVLLDFPGGVFHNAGRIKIGPDNLLYVAVGDFRNRATAQDLNSFGGKILRMNLDGSPAAGNPFAQAPHVYSYGFRDPQGLAFDSSGQLYGTDHGEASHDEVNIILAGKNYGWPTCEGICGSPDFVDPIKLFLPETAAPSGATFYNGATIPQWNGSLLFATLGLANNTFAKHIHRLKYDRAGGTQIVEEEILFRGEFGRIRTVVQGPDGFVYFSTSNGTNDRILRVRPQ